MLLLARALTPLTSLRARQRLHPPRGEQMLEEHHAFRSASDVRSFGELLGHIAGTQYLFCAVALGESNPQPEEFEKTRTTKAGTVDALRGSSAYCDRAYAIPDAQATTSVRISDWGEQAPLSILVLNSEHDSNFVTYLRLKKLVPPSSQPSS